MAEKVSENVWKFVFSGWGGNCYLIRVYDNQLNKKINLLIDTSSEDNKENLIKSLSKLKLKPGSIDAVLITHWHPDHYGNLDLFLKDSKRKTEIFISRKEIDFFKLQEKNFRELEKNKSRWEGLDMIYTPGHTIGSYCFLFSDNLKILFSGDTLFFNGGAGRTDFPSGDEFMLKESLKKLSKIKFNVLCPGHDY